MHLILTFGFSIPIKPNANLEDNENVSRKKNKVKRNKKSQRKEKNIIDEFETAESEKNIINVKQIIAEIHVEYDLLPGYTYKFDCRCWDTATKIYTEHGDWCLRPMLCSITDNALWVVFSVHHLVYLNKTQLRKYFNYVITCRMFYGKEKFSERAKKDNVKGFYIDDEVFNIDSKDFIEIYPLDMLELNSAAKPLTAPTPELLTITDEILGDYNISAYLEMIPDKIHQCKFRKMLRKERFPSESLKLELFAILDDVSKESKPNSKRSKTAKKSLPEKKSKASKSKKQKQNKETIDDIHLPAEMLFAGMGTITSYSKTSSSDSSILIYMQCDDILSDKKLRMSLNPISIKLEQLSHFPHNVVAKYGISYLYAKITFVNRTITTFYYLPAETIYFEFVKCYLLDDFQPEELISSVATEFLVVEIIGVRLKPSAVLAWEEEVLLGLATFDLSDLLRGLWEVRLTSSLFPPGVMSVSNISDRGGGNLSISSKDLILTSNILLTLGTCVKVKVRVAYDLRTVYIDIPLRDNIMNRIFIILNDLKLANDIFNVAFSHNHDLMLASYASDYMESKELETPKDILTGFSIDCCDKFYMFFEGLPSGYLLQLWDKVKDLDMVDGSVYYNSNHIFLTRLYEDFVPLNGVIDLKLNESLEAYLQKTGLYVDRTGSTIEATIMRTMGLMKLSSTMQSLCQEHLLPNSYVMNTFMDTGCKIENFMRNIVN